MLLGGILYQPHGAGHGIGLAEGGERLVQIRVTQRFHKPQRTQKVTQMPQHLEITPQQRQGVSQAEGQHELEWLLWVPFAVTMAPLLSSELPDNCQPPSCCGFQAILWARKHVPCASPLCCLVPPRRVLDEGEPGWQVVSCSLPEGRTAPLSRCFAGHTGRQATLAAGAPHCGS